MKSEGLLHVAGILQGGTCTAALPSPGLHHRSSRFTFLLSRMRVLCRSDPSVPGGDKRPIGAPHGHG